MIFKTFDSDIDKISSTVGILGKSFDDIFESYQNWKNEIADLSNPLKGGILTKNQAKQQVGGLFSYIFKDNSKDKLVEEFETFKSMMTDYGMTAKEVAKDLGDQLSPEIQSYVKSAKTGELTTEGFNKSIGNLSLGAKAGQVVLKGLALAGNMVVGILAGFVISEAIEGLDNLVHAADNAKESAESFSNSFSSMNDEFNSNDSKLSDLQKKYDELSKGVNSLGENVSLKQYLGSEYQRIILSNNLADIENFKNQYVAVESQINSNEQLKTSYEEKVDYYNNLKQQWEDCTSKYDDEMNKLYASQILGANWESEVLSGRLQTLTNFTSEYEKLCQRQADAAVNAANTEVQASKNAAAGIASTSSSVVGSGGGSSSSTSSAPKVTYDKNNNPNKPVQKSNDYWTYEKLSKGYSTSGQASSHISDYASKGANGFTQIGNKYFIVKWIANAGTPANASKAKNKLEKDHPKKIGKYGYAKRYHKGLELGKIEALPKDKAFDLVQDVGTNGLEADEVPIIAQKGEAVLTEEQIENLAKTLHLVPVQNELMEKMSKISLGDLPMNTPKMNFDASKVGQSVTKNNFAPSVTLNLNCPNVSSVSDAKAITDVVDKQLNKFANDFYQASLHYVNKK